MACYSCSGTGKERCIHCGGGGQKVHSSAIRGMLSTWRGTCYDCAGTGKMTCRSCRGTEGKRSEDSHNYRAEVLYTDHDLYEGIQELLTYACSRFNDILQGLTWESNGKKCYGTSYVLPDCTSASIWLNTGQTISYRCHLVKNSHDLHGVTRKLNSKCKCIARALPSSWHKKLNPSASDCDRALTAISPSKDYEIGALRVPYQDNSYDAIFDLTIK